MQAKLDKTQEMKLFFLHLVEEYSPNGGAHGIHKKGQRTMFSGLSAPAVGVEPTT